MSPASPIPVLDRRRLGVLLHISSLPGPHDHGDFSHDAWRFVEFLRQLGASVWQTLPLGYPHADGSPYQCLSAHAGNPLFISLDWLRDRGWLDDVPKKAGRVQRLATLRAARCGFAAAGCAADRADFARFVANEAHWLDDFALFMAVREAEGGASWRDWPAALRDRKSSALARARRTLAESVAQQQFEQWLFFRQWAELRGWARQHDVVLYGDLPIFVSGDSSDVWANRSLFRLDAAGRETVVAGVPPDYFSQAGQRWGNPLYDWDAMEAEDFRWWTARVATQCRLFDWVRVDHFRGFDACWEIPAEDATALNGRWVAAPGRALLAAFGAAFDPLPLIAEDLGVITPAVDELRRMADIPGMSVLQFAFDGNPANPHLPHNHVPRSVTYTGTHDNDTSLAWFCALSEEARAAVIDHLGFAPAMPDALIRAALASCARLAVLPMQDVLGLGEGQRMNVPGTATGNWAWRMDWDWVDEARVARVRHWAGCYGRA